MGRALVTAATHEPLSIEELKAHLRVDTDDEDATIDSLQSAVRKYCETFTGRQFVSATYDQTFEGWENKMLLDLPPLSSVTSVKYYDEDGVEQTLSDSIYDVVTNVEPGLIRLAYDQSWPTHRCQNEPITIRYVAGYGEAPAVPETIKQVIRLLVGHFFENREAVALLQRGQTFGELPMAVSRLLWSERICEAV